LSIIYCLLSIAYYLASCILYLVSCIIRQNENNEDLIQLISIYDITGRTIKTLNCNGNQQVNISVKDLESGAYKIEVIYLNNKKSYSTFIKQ